MANVEICFLDQSYDDFNLDELLNIDSSLFMSFLEDSQVEEGDDQVRAMIESPEPEIMNQDSCSETHFSDDGSSEECRFSEVVDQLECCSSLSHHGHHHHQDFEWIDMEMDYSCPSYEATGYFISRLTGDMVDVGGLDDYSQVCNGMAIEEDCYIGLWQ